MSDWTTLRNRLLGTLGIEEDDEALNQLFDVPVNHIDPEAGDAASTTANTKIWSNPFSYPLQLVAAAVNPAAAVTAHADNHATITILRDDGADGTPVACASVNSDADLDGSWVADTDKAMTLVAANCVLAAGANVFFATAKGGSGVDLPVTQLKLRFRRI